MADALAPRTAIAPQLLTVAQFMATTGLGRTKTYDLINAGVVASVRIGGCRRILAESVENLKRGDN